MGQRGRDRRPWARATRPRGPGRLGDREQWPRCMTVTKCRGSRTARSQGPEINAPFQLQHVGMEGQRTPHQQTSHSTLGKARLDLAWSRGADERSMAGEGLSFRMESVEAGLAGHPAPHTQLTQEVAILASLCTAVQTRLCRFMQRKELRRF